MSIDRTLSWTDWMGDRIEGLQEYAPEPLSEVSQRLGIPPEQLIKLDANENPYGPTPRAAQALREFSEYHRYPDPTCRRLRQAIGEFIGVDPSYIVVGNGSDELIDLTLRLFRPGRSGKGIPQVIDCPPTFGMYAFYGATNDMQVLSLPRRADYTLDLAAVEALCQEDPTPKILFAASPNNPDGQPLEEACLQRLLALPLLIVLDEAYIEFAGASRASWVPQRENLIVLRTFSKWAGLAGLRIGYGVFPQTLAAALQRLKSPYNVNGAAQAAALATLEDVEEAMRRVRRIVAERERLFRRLQEIPGIEPYPSSANYILCRLSTYSTAQVRAHLEARGILVRYFNGPGLENCIRITVGTPEQNDAVLRALEALASNA